MSAATPDLIRRRCAAAAGLALTGVPGLLKPSWAQASRRLRLLLNTSLSGPVAFFLLAQDRGYFPDEGLELSLASGPGAAAMVPMVRDGTYEVGYGNITALGSAMTGW